MERFNANVGPFQSTLEKTPKVFESVGVNLSVNVAFGMVNNLMCESLLLESHIGHECIGVDRAACCDVTVDFSMHFFFATVAYDVSANFSTTFQDAHDGSFILGASLSNPAIALFGMHVSGKTTNKSLVYFDFAIRSTEFQESLTLHCQPNSVEHEPCGFLSDAKSAANFIGTHAVLAVRNHPNSDKPLVEWKRRILKDSPDLCRELPFGMDTLALPLALILEEHDILTSAGGAHHDAIRPADFHHEVKAIIGIVEEDNRLLEGFWLGTHGVPHKPNVPNGV
jgi:hypothetical protein